MPDVVSRVLHVLDLGLIAYDDAWALQKAAARMRISGALEYDLLILCEHPPVVTLGRASKPHHLLASPEFLAAQNIELRSVERGGDVTIHEPGQLVGYPIVDLKQHRQDLHWYLRQIEESIIQASASLGVVATRRTGLTGVWVDDRKLASIGVHARDWVTWHGFALNVSNSLATFNHVVPCGIDGVTMTALHRECDGVGTQSSFDALVRERVSSAFANVFSLRRLVAPDSVRDLLNSEAVSIAA